MAKVKKNPQAAKICEPKNDVLNLLVAIEASRVDQHATHIDRLLDDALAQTFPASDAIAVVIAGGSRRRK